MGENPFPEEERQGQQQQQQQEQQRGGLLSSLLQGVQGQGGFQWPSIDWSSLLKGGEMGIGEALVVSTVLQMQMMQQLMMQRMLGGGNEVDRLIDKLDSRLSRLEELVARAVEGGGSSGPAAGLAHS